MKKFLFLFSILFFFTKPQTTFAEIIHSFDVNILAHKSGVMDVAETINYDFEYGERHGIYRYIPTYSKVGNKYRIIKIENVKVERDGQSENFSRSQSDEQVSFKIGNADKTITGDHIYKISYTVKNGIGSNFPDHDEIYWNSTGNGWDVDIEKAKITISTDFPVTLKNFLCFTGSLGSKNSNCYVSKNSAVTSQSLSTEEGLSAVSVYPVNTFPISILSNNPPQTIIEKIFSYIISHYSYIWIFFNIILVPILIFWYQKKKNKKRFGSPTVNFDIPKDQKGERVAPALSGTIDTSKLERDDITATIFDLAIRKYIKLKEEKTVKKFLPDSTNQKIIKLKEDDGKLNSYEKVLFDRLFRDGDTVSLTDLKIDFYQTYNEIEDKVFSELVKQGYYTKNPKVQKGILIFLSVVSLFSLNIFLALTLFYLSIRLIGRTPKGDDMDFKIDGLKLFLKSMDRNYNWQAKNFYTVEQMIPYAMALGYIEKFMEQLKIIKPDYNPSWYSGYSGSFYGNYAGFYSSMSTNMISSSSSGSGGGGFSGGGGGGGGGGSW